MDSKLLLVKSITLMYREGLLEDPTENSAALVREVIGSIRLPEMMVDTDPGRAIIVSLKTTALWMCDNPPGLKYDKGVMLQRIRVNIDDDDGLYMAFLAGIEDTDNVDLIKRACVEHRLGLRRYLDQIKVTNILNMASSRAKFNPEQIDWKTFVQDIQLSLEPFIRNVTDISREGVVDDIDLDDIAKMSQLFLAAKDDMASGGTMRTGWQGVNKMTGRRMGLCRGEFIVVPALPYMFKTGFTTNIFRQIAQYNTPYMLDPKKKPLLIRISCEDPLRDNVLALYQQLKENETGIVCDLSGLDPDEAAKYVTEKLQATGYTVYMARWDPTDVTFSKIFDMVTYFESLGYEIHAIVFDYLNMISKKGCFNNGVTGSEVRDLFRRVRNFMSARKITFITPHQLSPDAKRQYRQGLENFIQEIAGKGYYDSCSTIDQEVDLEIYIHIIKINGFSYLTIQRGKHRGVVTPEADLYWVYRFEEIAGIPDDINGPTMARKHAGGGTVGSKDETPWFANVV